MQLLRFGDNWLSAVGGLRLVAGSDNAHLPCARAVADWFFLAFQATAPAGTAPRPFSQACASCTQRPAYTSPSSGVRNVPEDRFLYPPGRKNPRSGPPELPQRQGSGPGLRLPEAGEMRGHQRLQAGYVHLGQNGASLRGLRSTGN